MDFLILLIINTIVSLGVGIGLLRYVRVTMNVLINSYVAKQTLLHRMFEYVAKGEVREGVEKEFKEVVDLIELRKRKELNIEIEVKSNYEEFLPIRVKEHLKGIVDNPEHWDYISDEKSLGLHRNGKNGMNLFFDGHQYQYQVICEEKNGDVTYVYFRRKKTEEALIAYIIDNHIKAWIQWAIQMGVISTKEATKAINLLNKTE